MGRAAVKITADTNILARAIADDDITQSPIAQAHLDSAELVTLTLPTLCELCWVFVSFYKVTRKELAGTIRTLISADNVKVDVLAVEAGLAMLDAGGDFADGIIAYEGKWLGGEIFLSFDEKAVGLLRARGEAAQIPK